NGGGVMQDFDVVLRSRSISDDDLCASCVYLDYRPGGTSVCVHPNFEPAWGGQCDENGYVTTCEAYVELTDADTAQLDELYQLTLIEHGETFLTDKQARRYVGLVDTLKSKNTAIPFGLEI